MLVCMYVCQPKIVNCQFFYVFFPTVVIYRLFQCSLRKKQKNVSLYVVCMYVRPKHLSVFFCFFYAPFPKKNFNFARIFVLFCSYFRRILLVFLLKKCSYFACIFKKNELVCKIGHTDKVHMQGVLQGLCSGQACRICGE